MKMVVNKEDDEGNTIHGGLIDSYLAGFHGNLLTEDDGVHFSDVIDHHHVYGFTTSNRYGKYIFCVSKS